MRVVSSLRLIQVKQSSELSSASKKGEFVMCNRLLRSFVIAAACCTVLGLAVPSYAQRGFGFRIQFGREARAVGLIHSAENRSDRFAAMLSGREDFLAEQARDLASQLNRVRSEA